MISRVWSAPRSICTPSPPQALSLLLRLLPPHHILLVTLLSSLCLSPSFSCSSSFSLSNLSSCSDPTNNSDKHIIRNLIAIGTTHLAPHPAHPSSSAHSGDFALPTTVSASASHVPRPAPSRTSATTASASPSGISQPQPPSILLVSLLLLLPITLFTVLSCFLTLFSLAPHPA